jgi:hypothetical protein
MFIVWRSPLARVISLAVSLAIVAIVYFAIIKPNTDTANNAAVQGEKQLQQALNQANKQSGGAIPVGATNLVNCIASAGTDGAKIQACQAKFKP